MKTDDALWQAIKKEEVYKQIFVDGSQQINNNLK